MISLSGFEHDPPDDRPKVTLNRPITARLVADALGIKPFQIIADLMELNHFTGISHEIPDELLCTLSKKHGVQFAITD